MVVEDAVQIVSVVPPHERTPVPCDDHAPSVRHSHLWWKNFPQSLNGHLHVQVDMEHWE